MLTPETVIENSNGRSSTAGEVNGLVFPTLLDTAPKLSITPSGSSEVYGLATPSPPLKLPVAVPPVVNPFTVPAPVTQRAVAVPESALSEPATEVSRDELYAGEHVTIKIFRFKAIALKKLNRVIF